MMISDVKKYKCRYCENGNEYHLPAAIVWVVKPPAPEILLKNNMKTIAMNKLTNRKAISHLYPIRNNRVATEELSKNSTLPKGKRIKNKEITFQRAMRLILSVGQLFSLFPVMGLASDDPEQLRFHFKSWRVLCSFISISMQFGLIILCIISLTGQTLNIDSATPVIFYINSSLGAYLLVRVAYKWPYLVRVIAKHEATEPCEDINLIRRCHITCFIIISLAAMEHALLIIVRLSDAQNCSPDTELYKAFILHSFPRVFEFIPYYTATGLLVQLLNTVAVFNWSFMDLFIICVSHYLNASIDQVNKRVFAVRGQYATNLFWRQSREAYGKVSQLVRRVDDVISPVVFVSFANNLYFVCHQLFHSLDHIGVGEHASYFVYSFVYLVLRYMAVFIFTSKVNSSSKLIATVLYDVPPDAFSIEVERFIEQVNSDTIAFTGLQFFNVTRGLLLTVIGTVVTYELILIQFNSIH